jgi:hypothetical protein
MGNVVHFDRVQLNPGVQHGYDPTAQVSTCDMEWRGWGRYGCTDAGERYKWRGNRALQPG